MMAANVKKVPLTCLTLPQYVETKTHQTYPNINRQHVGCSAEFGKETTPLSPPQPNPTQHVCREWGEVGYLMINLRLVHLELLTRNAWADGDFGNAEYLTGEQKLPLWPRHGFNSTVNVTWVAESWERLSSSPSWGKRPDLASKTSQPAKALPPHPLNISILKRQL